MPPSCWAANLWGPVPCWPTDPDASLIESTSRKHLPIPDGHRLTATFLAEGAFNKLYTISTFDDGGIEAQLAYVFRVTLPVEPLYKTASEVATLAYIREHTSVPVPRVVAHCSTADNDLGFEWILMEKVQGVTLKSVWREMDMETKDRVTRVVAQYVKQLCDRCSFNMIGNLYFRKDLSDGTVRTASTTDDRFVVGPVVTALMFAGGRKLGLPRNLGPYADDAEYTAALMDAEAEDLKFLQLPEARTHVDFDSDVAEDAPMIEEALRALQNVWTTLFPSHLHPFALTHHDLSLSNILVDPATYSIAGIVDWECTGPRPHWQDEYPQFLLGEEIDEKPELPSRDDTDQSEYMMGEWEDWEKTVLRSSWDEELGKVSDRDDKVMEWREQLVWLEISPNRVMSWAKKYEQSRVFATDDTNLKKI